MTVGFPSQVTSKVELWCIFYVVTYAAEQTIQLQVIWDKNPSNSPSFSESTPKYNVQAYLSILNNICLIKPYHTCYLSNSEEYLKG